MDNLTDLVPLVLVGLIGLVVGALFGVFVGNFINRSENTSQRRRRNLVEVLHVWKDRQSGDVQLELEGTVYTSLDKLDAKRNSDLIRTLEEINRWMGLPDRTKGLKLQTTPPKVDQPTPKPAPLTPAETNNVSLNPSLIDNSALPPYEFIEDTNNVTKPSSVLNPVNILERALRPKSDTEIPEPKSIAGQIDEILQRKLPSSPLKNHIVKLLELPEKGLVVLVDQQQYQGVGEVPDPEIRALLQECVTEWEQSVGS
jgi:hypothetical protein